MTTTDLKPGGMASPRSFAAWPCCYALVLLTATLTGIAGCGTSSLARRARTAELRGQSEDAYRLYYQAAAESPSSDAVASGLNRVAPRAAAAWEKRARVAQASGDDDTAWRLYMLVLEARPDHPTAPEAIRSLERKGSVAVARARAEWERDGMSALLPGSATVATSATGDVARESTAPTRDEPSVSSEEEPPVAVVEKPAPTRRPARDRSSVEEARQTATPVEPEAPRDSERAPADERRADIRAFQMVSLISLDDRHFRRSAAVGDGIEIRLRAVDDRPSADVDVYVDGDRAVRKRGWQHNEALQITGRSGRAYEAVLLSIFERTETIRFGIARRSLD